MPYSPTLWIEKATQVGPTNLNKLENGLAAAAAVADSASALGTAALPVTIYDAKGDLIVGTAADAAARLAAGSVGQVLTADPATATGLRWRDRTTYGTSPPASPQDGDEWVYPVDVAAGVAWRFRYNAGSASGFKWEFVGGADAWALVQTDETMSATGLSWVDLATVGPSFVVPRAGDYDWQAGCKAYATISQPFEVGVAIAAGTPGASAVFDFTTGAGNAWATVSFSSRSTGLGASNELRLRYAAFSAATNHFANRWLRVRPVRVS